MRRYFGSDWVKTGFYWNSGNWEVVPMSKEGGELPGASDQPYVRIPALMVLPLAPLMGGLYVVFLPCIGLAMLLGLAGKKLLAAVRRAGGIIKEKAA
jgi:hypothetical protein